MKLPFASIVSRSPSKRSTTKAYCIWRTGVRFVDGAFAHIMRLINTTTLQLEDFTLRDVPPYAILSHTWAEDEVSFQEMLAGNYDLRSKQGYTKIVETCRLAIERGLDYAWVDTCCIDKCSSAELTEAINSMFSYYAKSSICFAYLVDLHPGTSEEGIDACRWFTRGWTLQELIAPRELRIYDRCWNCIGSRSSLISVISTTTRIPEIVLSEPRRVTTFSIAEKMSWASRRSTTREEDIAYCLLGIFDINMSLIYGEGPRAFRRLQEEILKRNTDMTIFLWRFQAYLGPADTGQSLLAGSPAVFSDSAGIIPLVIHFPEFSVTNKGLLVAPDTPLRIIPTENGRFSGLICMYLGRKQGLLTQNVTLLVLPLRKLGPSLYCRHKDVPWIEYDMKQAAHDFHCLQTSSSYHIAILDGLSRRTDMFRPFRQYAIHVPRMNSLMLTRVVPEHLWDPEDRVFLRPNPEMGGFFTMVIALFFQSEAAGFQEEGRPVIVLCDNTTGRPRVGTVLGEDFYLADGILFEKKCLEHSLPWADFYQSGIRINWSVQNDAQVEPSGHSIIVAGTPEAPLVSLETRLGI
jgi:hypothetical protein